MQRVFLSKKVSTKISFETILILIIFIQRQRRFTQQNYSGLQSKKTKEKDDR